MYSLLDSFNELEQLIKLIDFLSLDLLFCNLCDDNRLFQQGDIFLATSGKLFLANDIINMNIVKNAKYIISDDDSSINNYYMPSLSLYIGFLAAIHYNFPSKKLNLIGITGTNGKSTVAFLLSQILCDDSAMIGTLGIGKYPNFLHSNYTTPTALNIQKILHNFVDIGIHNVFMEVSSHSLVQGRVNGTFFDTAIFTNLTLEHLDYHRNFSNYYAAKKKLFFWYGLKNVIINIDDKYGRLLCDELRDGISVITYAIERKADLYATNIKSNLFGSTFLLHYKEYSISVNIALIGKFNIYNVLAVSAVLLLHNFSLKDIANSLNAVSPPLGRMDLVHNKPLVLIDFAHTPDSLCQVLTVLKSLCTTNTIYCIFGCGGERDILKRSIMGKYASNLADKIIITNDNPRNESQQGIVNDIMQGVENNNAIVILDRREAIYYALSCAKDDDIVMILGKGHEQYQIINDQYREFSDYSCVKEFFRGMAFA